MDKDLVDLLGRCVHAQHLLQILLVDGRLVERNDNGELVHPWVFASVSALETAITDVCYTALVFPVVSGCPQAAFCQLRAHVAKRSRPQAKQISIVIFSPFTLMQKVKIPGLRFAGKM